jgi:hypothetical protein
MMAADIFVHLSGGQSGMMTGLVIIEGHISRLIDGRDAWRAIWKPRLSLGLVRRTDS